MSAHGAEGERGDRKEEDMGDSCIELRRDKKYSCWCVLEINMSLRCV